MDRKANPIIVKASQQLGQLKKAIQQAEHVYDNFDDPEGASWWCLGYCR